MIRDALSDVNKVIRVGGRLIKTVRYADDQATIASFVKGVQHMKIKCRKPQKNMV